MKSFSADNLNRWIFIDLSQLQTYTIIFSLKRDDAYAQRKQWYNSIARHEQAYPQWRTVCAHMARVTSDKRFTHTFFIPLLFHYLLISQPDICTRGGSGGGEIGSRS